MKQRNLAIIAGSGLVALNVVLMGVISVIPGVGSLFSLLWQYPIVGVLIFGAGLTAGNWLAKTGIREGSSPKTGAGSGLLMISYGVFGAGILASFNLISTLIVLVITSAVTGVMALIIGLGVNYSNRSFKWAQRYSFFLFVGVVLAAGLGTIFPSVLVLAFILALTGFLLNLVYEIWFMLEEDRDPWLHAVGLYVAVAGVFVHILQMVARWYLEE